jgi:hypothetical protein
MSDMTLTFNQVSQRSPYLIFLVISDRVRNLPWSVGFIPGSASDQGKFRTRSLIDYVTNITHRYMKCITVVLFRHICINSITLR